MPKRISKLQLTRLYWPRWRAAEKVLIQQGQQSKDEAEATRKEIHQQVLGYECSSKDIPANKLDDILGKFAAISMPNNGKAQAHHADQPLARIRFKITEVMKRMNLTTDYVNAMAVRIAKRPLMHCDEAGLTKVLSALNTHEKRHAGDEPAVDPQPEPSPSHAS
jgi:hypothetical protein